jgi:predicted Zn-dependent peptidase
MPTRSDAPSNVPTRATRHATRHAPRDATRRAARLPWLVAAAALAGVSAAACARSPRAATTAAPAASPTATADSAADSTRRAAGDPRRERPALGALPALRLPPAVERTLPNGLRLVVVEHRELPVADFVLVVGTGGEADPAGKEGLATLTANLLDEGAGGRTALQIADQESYLGIALDAAAGWDASQVTLHTPTAQLDSALALFADVVTRPSLPAREFDRLKRERLTGLLQLRDEPTEVADRAFSQLLYGTPHPYGRPLGGSEASTRAIARADVERFYRAHYRPNNATLIVVGDVTADDVAARVGRALGAWQRADVAAHVVPEAPGARQRAEVYLIDKADAPQTSIRIGAVGVPRATEDYFALRVLNTILGGSFTSRLNQNLRETRGYTYGAGSAFDMRRAAGPFVAEAEVTGTKTDSALVEFMKELRAIRDTVPAAELDKAKRYLQLQLPGRFETTGNIAGQLVPIVVHGLPLTYYNDFVDRLERVSQADVQRAAQRHLDPSKFLVVLVGDRKSIESGVRALDLGPITVRTVSDVMGSTHP